MLEIAESGKKDDATLCLDLLHCIGLVGLYFDCKYTCSAETACFHGRNLLNYEMRMTGGQGAGGFFRPDRPTSPGAIDLPTSPRPPLRSTCDHYGMFDCVIGADAEES